MRALRWHDREDLRVDEVEQPVAAAGEVTIEVAWCGICGTDLHEFVAGPNIIATEPHPGTGGSAPITIGHELSGKIAELGAGVAGLAIGDRVTIDPCLPCGECWHCRTGEIVRCETIGFVGMHRDGGMARRLVVPASVVHRLPDNVDLEVAALIEPLTVAMRAVQRSRMQAGDTATIVGAGPIGLLNLLMTRAAGAAEVFVVERSPARMKLALELGASAVVDPGDGDAAGQVRALTAGGRGTNVGFECVGLEPTLSMAVNVTRKGGTTVVLGFFEEAVSFHPNDVLLAERTLVGSVGSVRDFPAAIALIADGRIDPRPLITGRIGLENAVDQGFRALIDNRDSQVKVLVRPG